MSTHFFTVKFSAAEYVHSTWHAEVQLTLEKTTHTIVAVSVDGGAWLDPNVYPQVNWDQVYRDYITDTLCNDE